MATLLLMRHAKSDWNTGAMTDHERPLNPRGAAAAATMGRVLRGAGLDPDRIVASSAVRTATTARLVADSAGWGAPVEETDALYNVGVDDVLAVIATTAASVAELMIVGHEPTTSALIGRLTGASVIVKTATATVLTVPDGWDRVGPGRAGIVAVLQPRHFTT